ncbi:MAG: ATP-dependent helicase [Muribaculaceae bacterium]|nr:ATP-dependent helicase [Muribaculaceae bacterium]
MSATYLDELNEQQRLAVKYITGPQLVVAGAGSGKTRVLTYKIMHLLANGYDPGRILALTFTNKAAKEMKERITAQVGEHSSRRLWMGTFHSIFSRILRRNAEHIGFTPNFTIYDQSDSRNLVKLIVKDMNLDDKYYKPATIQNEISNAKNQLISPEQYARDKDINAYNRKAGREKLAAIFNEYVRRCRISDAMDFDDLLYYTAVLFRDHVEILRHYREFFQYVLVDEFQDTNFAQNYILISLTKGIGNLCVVGDDAQSIYSFRGANIRNILDLKRSYPDLETFKLEQNYRSTQNIINAANTLIEKNRDQIKKRVFSVNDPGDRIEVQTGSSDYDEAGLVASKIVTRQAMTGDPFSEFAILYRTNAQSRVLEEALRRRNITYRIYGGLAFYQRKEVKDALSYFRLSVNPNDDEALRRVINVPARGIGDTTVGKLTRCALDACVSIWTVLTDPERYGLDVNRGTMSKLNGFISLIEKYRQFGEKADAESHARFIIQDAGLLRQYLSDSSPENISKIQNLEELIRGAHEFVEERKNEGSDSETTLASFLTTVSLQTDQDQNDPALANSVTLMTIHAAKGLEFSNVFIVGVEADLLPSLMSHNSMESVEEERRLLYVAITRAKKFCMITYAKNRYLNGQTMDCRPSPFLNDIDGRYLKFSYGAQRMAPPMPRPKTEPSRPRPAVKPTVRQSTASTGSASQHRASELKVNMEIEHLQFGHGIIQDITVSELGEAIIVKFDNENSVRKLLLSYAKFNIITQ